MYSHQNQGCVWKPEERGASPHDSDRLPPLPILEVAAAAPPPPPVAALGTTKVPSTAIAIAGIVPLPVALTMSSSAFSSNHRMVSPSDLKPSCLVSSNNLAVDSDDIRILRPRPSTFTCRSAARFLAGATSNSVEISRLPSVFDDLEAESLAAGTTIAGSDAVYFSITRFSSFRSDADAIHDSSIFLSSENTNE